MSSPISLYFHVPFCTKKCSYCHFYVIPEKDFHKTQLMEGFKLEWYSILPRIQGSTIKTIYFGGGTPSLIGPAAIESLLEMVYKTFSPAEEVTLEANPENITLEQMQAFKKAGVNRVSIGIQTLDNQLLKSLGRLHTAGKGVEAVEQTATAGIENISIDLMYDLPHQTLATWENTLKEASALPITHLSLYNLTIEPHTIFYKHRKALQKVIPDEETSLQMYEMAIRMLTPSLEQYEISAFAKQGYPSKHNTGYWIGRPFWGLGPSAFSYFDQKRFRNVASLNKYCQALKENTSPIDFSEQLDPDAARRELLAINLRLVEGVYLPLFEQRHGTVDREVTQHLIDQGLLTLLDDRLKLTKQGVLFYDTVAAELI